MNSFEVMLYITSFNTIFVILCFIYISLKEKENKKKRDIYAQIFESLTQEIHFIKKTINTNKQKADKEPKFDEMKMKDDIKKQSISILNEVLPSIIDTMQELNTAFYDFKDKSDTKNRDIQKQIKEYSSLSLHTNSVDERQIIKMYKNGETSEEISIKLGVPKSEIELAIKMYKT